MPDDERLVQPRTLRGFQDLLPQDFIPRKAVIAVIEGIYEKYGYLPLDTPAVEHLETLLGTGGEETNKELFTLETPEGEPVALRYDLTVGFARLLAQYPDRLKPPFRRYASGPVWRVNKPGPGRFRQFTQLDIDAAGSENVALDAEIIAIMCEILTTLGVERYEVRVNTRRLMDAVLEGCGILEQDRQKHVLRVVDKLAKVGVDNVRLELGPGRIDESGDPIPGVGLTRQVVEKILDFIAVQSDTRAGVVEMLRGVLPPGEAAESALRELEELAEDLNALGLPDRYVKFDPSLARGLDYYTGPVFEGVLTDAAEFGSVMGGGRYNQLVSRFLDQNIPCTGMAVGLDRLTSALTFLGLIPALKTTVQVLVVTMGKVPACETLKLAAELRAAGIRTEAFFGPKMNLKSQLSHADRTQIPVAVLLGEDEVARGQVSVKDLMAGKKERADIADHAAYRQAGRVSQVTVARQAMVETVRKMLEQG
ncbi:MAG: histidine--tRNA ligase [Candidatus Hydrogenedentes bacterium]|nr:histidine--tRNA ligase [Candidatus Hydrogenedentota bacterium]